MAPTPQMYAIAVDRNRQVLVHEGDSVLLDYNKSWEPGAEVVLDRVCLVVDGENSTIGTPYIEGAKVILQVKEDKKGPKVVVGKFKRRKNYRRKTGHRARYIRVVVKGIEA